jgi:hypothetical protein
MKACRRDVCGKPAQYGCQGAPILCKSASPRGIGGRRGLLPRVQAVNNGSNRLTGDGLDDARSRPAAVTAALQKLASRSYVSAWSRAASTRADKAERRPTTKSSSAFT